jgi:hypothetical protein
VDLVKTKDGPGSDKKIFGPGSDPDPRKIKNADPGPARTREKKIFRPGPGLGSGHASSSLRPSDYHLLTVTELITVVNAGNSEDSFESELLDYYQLLLTRYILISTALICILFEYYLSSTVV